MALAFENDFVVAAPIEQTWTVLLDLERVANCLPGASVEPAEAGAFKGSMRVKVGPMTMEYTGTAKLTQLDEASHLAVFEVEGRERRGQGTASARITNQAVADGDRTRVRVETELLVTGRAAQFGRGIMQDVATSLLSEFAQCLSTTMAAEPPLATAPAGEREEPTPVPALELTTALRRALRHAAARWTRLSTWRELTSRLRHRTLRR